MLGAHFDSWHGATGATDNASGSAVMMEAMRILKQCGLKMRRTVRIGLWGGEEQGLIGSREYVTAHFANVADMILKPAHAKFAGYFNVDNGTGAIRGVYLQGNEAVGPIFERVDEAVQQPRHDHPHDPRHRRHRSPVVRSRRPAGIPVHPGRRRIRHAHASLQHGQLRAHPGRGHAQERGDRRGLRLSRGEPRREAAPEAAAGADRRTGTGTDNPSLNFLPTFRSNDVRCRKTPANAKIGRVSRPLDPTSATIRTLLFLFTLLTDSGVWAQTPRATIRGVIVDQTGARLPGVEIKVLREETNETRQTVSDRQGYFAFPELPPGPYSIEARHPGFTIFRHRAEVAVGQELWLEPELVVTTTATVTTGGFDSTVPLLERNSPALATLIDQDLVENLPLDGRNFLELSLLTPGTVPAPQGSASSVRGDFAFSTNGAREDFNNFVLDGVYNIDPKLNTPSVRPPVDGIREFEVVSSTYDASFGRNAAGQVNVLTRSGSNTLTGSAYEFFRNQALAARNHFAPEGEPEPDTSAISSAARWADRSSDRTFFFADYERTWLRKD